MSRRRLEYLLVYLMAAVAFGYFYTSYDDDNAYSRMSLVRALVEERRFEIDTYQKNGELPTGDRASFHGHAYSDKAIGSSLIGAALYAPLYAAASFTGWHVTITAFRKLVTFLAVGLVCASLAPIIYAYVRRASPPGLALLVTVSLLFGTAIFKYSVSYYGHVQAGLFLFAAFCIWHAVRLGAPLTFGRAFGAGLLVGLAILTEYPAAAIALAVVAYAADVTRRMQRSRDWRTIVAAAAGAAIPIAVLLLYDTRVFGAPLSLGYEHHANAEFAAAHASGLVGIGVPDLRVLYAMTFHPMMGIFRQSPILLLAFAGWSVMIRRRVDRAELVFSLAVIGGYLVLISGYYMWWGGWSYTPRHLIPIVPFFAIPLSRLPRRWIAYAIAWPLAAVSVGLAAIVAASRLDGIGPFLDHAFDGKYPAPGRASMIYDIFVANFRAGRLVDNQGALFGLTGGASLVPLVVLEVALACAVVAIARRAPNGAGEEVSNR